MLVAQGSTVQECLKEDPSLWKVYQCLVTTFPDNQLFSLSQQLMRLMLRGLLKITALGGSRHEAQLLPLPGWRAMLLLHTRALYGISVQGSLRGSSEKCCPR